MSEPDNYWFSVNENNLNTKPFIASLEDKLKCEPKPGKPDMHANTKVAKKNLQNSFCLISYIKYTLYKLE